MRKSVFDFKTIEPWVGVSSSDWQNWQWQLRRSLKTSSDFQQYFDLSSLEQQGFSGADKIFRVQTTPYYASLMDPQNHACPVRKMIVPTGDELSSEYQQMLDPLGENKKSNRPCERLVHRYRDRALLLVTDMCGVYCRYCTRKHFTASDQVLASEKQIDEAVEYLKKHPEIKEVILSGGDPLTVSNNKLAHIFTKIDQVSHIELIRVASRFPVVNPMRMDDGLVDLFKEFRPVYLMTHFNHPAEVTLQSALALEKCVDNGIPVFNQLVLLNGINNHPALIYALSRRLLYLRVKPYYMFQADPSMGTDHLRTSIEESLEIQRQLWGHTSGLAMPTYIVDVPDGGGKVALTPDFQTQKTANVREFCGYDGVNAKYISSKNVPMVPALSEEYLQEWRESQ